MVHRKYFTVFTLDELLSFLILLPLCFKVFADDLHKDRMWEIMEKIMGVYDKESDLPIAYNQ